MTVRAMRRTVLLTVMLGAALAMLLQGASADDAPPEAKVALDWPVCADASLDFGYAAVEESPKVLFHPGVDFSGASGLEVRAAAPGTVVIAEERGAYGLSVAIEHRSGLLTRYASLTSALVKRGDRVARGQLIGRVDAGAPGHEPRILTAAQLMEPRPQATRALGRAPHLHFELWVWDVVRDPLQFLCPRPGCMKMHPSGAPRDARTLKWWPLADACQTR